MNSSNTEIEMRFLNIDVNSLKKKLEKLGAQDLGEDFLTEKIFYDADKTWLDEQRFARIRTTKKGTVFSYKHQHAFTTDGTTEIEFSVSDPEKLKDFLQEIGIKEFRIQEKKRHTFRLDNVTIDIDMWPKVPPYVELEGNNEGQLQEVAHELGFDWKEAVFENAKIVIEKYYKIPVSTYKYFTFEKQE